MWPILAAVAKVAGTVGKNMLAKSAIGKAFGTPGQAPSSQSASSNEFTSVGSNTYIHPMAQKAMGLDMGFYKHMDSKSISKGKAIMGGINGPCKCKGGR